MKKVLVLFFMVGLVVSVNAQVVQEVVEVEAPAELLYERAGDFIEESFWYSNQDENYVGGTDMILEGFEFDYDIIIEVKDGKYRYTINPKNIVPTTASKVNYWGWCFPKKHWGYKHNTNLYYKQRRLNSEIETLQGFIYESMSNEGVVDQDNW